MEVLQEKKKLGIVATIVVVLVLLLIGIAYVFKNNFFSKTNYIIQGVPYIGIFNHKGDLASFGLSDTQAAIYAIMEYWDPGKNNPNEINSYLGKLKRKSYADVIGFFNKKHSGEYSARLVDFKKATDFEKYINSSSKTPLLILLPIDAQQPIDNYKPAKILIGIEENRKVLTFHDFWLGNNYEINFDDFDKLAAKSKGKFIAIQPTNLNEKLQELSSRSMPSYSARTTVMDKCENAFKNYAIGRVAANNKMNDVAKQYIERVRSDSCFEQYFPNVFKMGTYIYLTNFAVLTKSPTAIDLANKAISLNQNLNKPSNDWPGFEIPGNKNGISDQSSEPYWMAGRVYMQLGDLQKAKENFEKALDINPNYIQAKKELESVKAALSAKGNSENVPTAN
jgi:tetratricopeptide (TPR) repeat protein